jgi:hypothetical protein
MLLGKVTAAAFEHQHDVSALLAALSHPAVVKATVKSALVVGPKGAADRRMLLRHANFLPVRNGTSAIFDLRQQINNAHEADAEEPTSLPSFSSDIIAFNAVPGQNSEPSINQKHASSHRVRHLQGGLPV